MKKIINVLIAVILLFNLLSVTIYAEDVSLKTYVQNGYMIEYNIVNSWGNSQNITVTIKNTGTEAIDNWMLEYDFKGDIVGIWNAVIATDSSGFEYVKNAGHNAVIEPESSVVFGYTLENAAEFPDSIVMCQEESVKENGYSIELKVIDEWDDNFNGEIIITNTTDKPIECWKLSFDSNFTIVEITDSWAASMIYANEGNYTLKGTYTNIIYGNSSVSIRFIGKKSGTPQIIGFSLTEVSKADNFSNSGNESDLIDIGQIYFKDIQSEDDIEYDGDGIYYVRDQLLLTANDNIAFDDIESLALTLNAEIVGYIELTNDYQIEFNKEMTLEELNQIINELNMNPFIEYSSLNTVIEVGETYMPQDYNENSSDNVTWGLEAIKAFEAWDKFDKSNEENKNRETVKMGLIDSSFDENHYDLNFTYVWNNSNITTNKHGTHVAGIMAATFDNKANDTVTTNIKNVSGICPKNKLYAVAIEDFALAFEYKCSLALLIGNNVRVINISQNSGDTACFAASNGNETAKKYFDINSKSLERFLSKLIDKGYDFLIVTSAGNTNIEHFTENKKAKFGYDLDSNGSFYGNANASYGLFLNCINSKVRDRIICVGSIGFNNSVEELYYFDTETCIGSRVDVVAPGVNIYSTIPDNKYGLMIGTSMAAPHVSGIAGMMYSVNPNLTAEQVKNIIVSTASQKIKTTDGKYSYGLVNAKAAVDKVLGVDNDIYEEKTNGIILGKVVEKVNNNDKDLKDVNIIVYENTGSEIRKAEDIDDEKTNEKGEYEIVLPAGDYVLEFTKDGYVAHREMITVIDNLVNKIDDIKLAKGVGMPVKDQKSNIFISNVDIETKALRYGETKKYVTDESGEFVFDGHNDEYIITFKKMGYNDKIINVIVEDGLLYDQNGIPIKEILLDPIKVIINGKVEKYDKNKNKIEPYKNFKVSIYQKPQSEKDDSNFKTYKFTDSEGNYEVFLESVGDYIVFFTEEKQHEISVSTSGTFTINEIIECEIEKDNNGNSGNNGNSDSGNEDWFEIGNDGIGDDGFSFNLDGDGGTSYTGDAFSGDLSSGIWLKTTNGIDNYYVQIYTTSDSGEFKSTFGAPGWGLYTSTYHHWAHELKMATYRSDGTLIYDTRLDYFYDKVYIGLYGSVPLMKIDSITSAKVDYNGITYNMYTDGYYKEVTNFIGSLGVREEKWEKNVTRNISFYNNAKCVGVSSQSPF